MVVNLNSRYNFGKESVGYSSLGDGDVIITWSCDFEDS